MVDPRIQFEVDVASALTLEFKSNNETEKIGMHMIVLEINSTIYTVRDTHLNKIVVIQKLNLL